MSDFAKFSNPQCSAVDLEDFFTNIHNETTEMQNYKIPSMISAQDDIMQEFNEIYKKSNLIDNQILNFKLNECNLRSLISAKREILDNMNNFSKNMKEKRQELEKSIKDDEIIVSETVDSHKIKVFEIMNMIRDIPKSYDKVKLQQDMVALEKEIRELSIKINDNKLKIGRVSEELKNNKGVPHIDNLKTVLDGLTTLDNMKKYLQEVGNSLDTSIENITKPNQTVHLLK